MFIFQKLNSEKNLFANQKSAKFQKHTPVIIDREAFERTKSSFEKRKQVVKYLTIVKLDLPFKNLNCH